VTGDQGGECTRHYRQEFVLDLDQDQGVVLVAALGTLNVVVNPPNFAGPTHPMSTLALQIVLA
jgi:hypothetical protein